MLHGTFTQVQTKGYNRILHIVVTSKQSGAVEACWAHNPEVRGSKPRSANFFVFIFFRLTYQTWSSRDLSLGLETSLDLFSQVSVLVLGLEPSSLALDLGLCLGTWDHKDSVFVTHEA